MTLCDLLNCCEMILMIKLQQRKKERIKYMYTEVKKYCCHDQPECTSGILRKATIMRLHNQILLWVKFNPMDYSSPPSSIYQEPQVTKLMHIVMVTRFRYSLCCDFA